MRGSGRRKDRDENWDENRDKNRDREERRTGRRRGKGRRRGSWRRRGAGRRRGTGRRREITKNPIKNVILPHPVKETVIQNFLGVVLSQLSKAVRNCHDLF